MQLSNMNKLFQADLATVMEAYSDVANSPLLRFINATLKSFGIVRVDTNLHAMHEVLRRFLIYF